MNALASSMVGKMKIRFTLPAHCGFEFLDRDRNFPVTQHAAALIGNTDFSQLRLDISKFRDMTSSAVHAVGDAVTGGGETVAQAAVEPVYWNYGAFIQQCIDFTILAFCVFMMVKLMNRLMKKKEEAPAPAAGPVLSKEEQLLTEIRDLLKAQKK